MSEFELTLDEKRQVIANRIKGLEEQKYNLELNIELAASYPGQQGVADQARRQIMELEDGIEKLQGIMAEVMSPGESNGKVAKLPNRANRRAAAKEKE